MDKKVVIEFCNVGKQYRLGRVGTGSLHHDLNRWWQTSIMRKEDPYLKIGDTNDPTIKGESEYIWALRNISFKVNEGDIVGIIGKNGSGKSTMLKLLSHITTPTVGDIYYSGKIASLLEVGTGFHPELTARENIFMNGSILGMTRHEIKSKLDEIVDFSGVERYLDTPIKRFSSGMKVRVGFAVAAFLEPEILIVDEVLAVGDAEFQKKALGKMEDVSQKSGRTVLFVSHNMAAVRSLCKTGIVLNNGFINYAGTANDAIDHYLSSVGNSQQQPIISHIKKKAPFIIISKIMVNGTDKDDTTITSNQRSFTIRVEGHTSETFKGSLQIKLRNMSGAALATYSEGAYWGELNEYSKGDFVIEREIALPEIVGTGDCYAEIELNRHTQKNITYFFFADECIHIHFEGNAIGYGHSLLISEEGLFGLSNI